MKLKSRHIDIEIDKLTNSIENYEKTLGAIKVVGHLMIINTEAALKLIDKYFKN
jgi:hypothetical protein